MQERYLSGAPVSGPPANHGPAFAAPPATARVAAPPLADHPHPQYGAPSAETGFGQSPDSVVHWVLPTGRSWQSILAGYLAVFALVVWPFGPVALGVGVWALVRSSRDGSHGRGRAVFAVVVGGLSTAVALLFLVSAYR